MCDNTQTKHVMHANPFQDFQCEVHVKELFAMGIKKLMRLSRLSLDLFGTLRRTMLQLTHGAVFLSAWKEGSGNSKGMYTCRVCNDGIWQAAKYCARHVESEKHQNALSFGKGSRILPRHDNLCHSHPDHDSLLTDSAYCSKSIEQSTYNFESDNLQDASTPYQPNIGDESDHWLVNADLADPDEQNDLEDKSYTVKID